VARYTSIMTVISLGVEVVWCVRWMDVKTAFLNGVVEEEVYVSNHRGLRSVTERHMFTD
jgi:hypothetical protein